MSIEVRQHAPGKDTGDFIRAAFASVASMAIVPLQDVLGLGTEARMNLPNSTSGNWLWRFREGSLTEKLAERLNDLSNLYARVHHSTEEEEAIA